MRILITGIAWALLSLALPPAAAAQNLDVKRMALSNGLVVLALEDHTFPSVALQITFKVGSRNERPGITGLSHLFEHMMFNGSARFKPKMFDTLIETGGGYSNAYTTTDVTAYHEEFSTGTLDTVLQLEADRMRSLRLDVQNLEQERSIVKEERRVNTDESPEAAMYETLWNNAFVAHPYRWLTIGFMADLNAIRLDDAKEYFRIFYAPNNSVMAVVGDFKTDDLFAKVRKYFSGIPRQPAPGSVTNAEPSQQGEKRIQLHRTAELPAVMIGYKGISFKQADEPALNVLASILARGESSRLYRELVYDKQIAASVSASNDSRIDPGLFTFYAQAKPGKTAQECEQAIYGALERIRKSGVEDREVQKAKNGIRVGYLNGFKTNMGRAGMLADYEANWGSWKELLNYVPRHDKVTAADVKRMAVKYFNPRKRTVVTLIPEKSEQASESDPRSRARRVRTAQAAPGGNR